MLVMLAKQRIQPEWADAGTLTPGCDSTRRERRGR